MMANKNPGNFANDREKASEAGRKGGQQGGGNMTEQERNQESGRRGGQNQQSNQERGRQ